MEKDHLMMKKRLEDLFRQAYTNNSFVFSRFLSPSDAVIAKLYDLSGSEARRLFTAGMVLVNGRSCGNESMIPKEKDTFAVRGYGKFVFDGVGEKTRKGNVMVKVRKYI